MSNKDLWLVYRRGWTDGAKATAMDTKSSEHEDPQCRSAYADGYKDGYDARCLYSASACMKYGYIPSPLRTE